MEEDKSKEEVKEIARGEVLLDGMEPLKVGRTDVQLRAIELIWGNTVVIAIISVTILGIFSLIALTAGKMESATAEKIIIGIVSGVLGAAGGMTLSKLTK